MNITLEPQLVVLVLFSSVIALAGGCFFLYTKKFSAWLEKYGVPFAAGTMIVAALMGLLPEAEHMLGVQSYGVFIVAFLIAFIFEQLLVQMHHHSEESHQHEKSIQTAIPMVLVGDTIHNFIDGVTIAATYSLNPALALVTAVSTFLHEVPHEIGDFSILLKAGWQKRNIFLVNIISALFTFVGAFFVGVFPLSNSVLGYLLASTAGIFFYLGVVDFLPHAFHNHSTELSFLNKVKLLFPVLLGGLIMAFSLSLVPHDHSEHEDKDIIHAELHVDDHGDEDHEDNIEHESELDH